ncbi:MAG: chemotaxis protein CheA [Actinomycetia bacterium]|nr:chemotaxis protein CheA [Actinomycetes bacterium]
MDEIIGEFLVESYEGLDQMDQNLVSLEESPDDVATLKEVFRTLHTIKGTCGFLGFGYLERVAHAGENLLSLLRDGERSMTPEIANALLATVDTIREILATIDQTEEEGEPNIDDVVAMLGRLTSDDPEAEAGAATAADHDAAPAEAESEVEATSGETDDTTIADGEDCEAGGETEEPARIGDLLVDAGSADRTDVEIAAVEQQMGDDRKLGKILVDEGRATPTEVETAVTTQRASASDSTIRVDVALLDRLMNLVGELVLSRNQIIQLAGEQEEHGFGPPAQRLNLITSELQEGVMKTRMQPINNVWGKLPRVVRDLSQQMGKNVRIEMVGKDTELDRTIIEAIKDPLTHIVRNTVDHGIEAPEDRKAAGKDPEGLLLLRASHEGGQVNIEISDDGRGISAEPLRAKAVEQGYLTAETAAKMSDTEIVQFIFRPGISTAGKVSNVSGRGVGMDVVKTNVERIGGSVDLKTELGVGTTFKIKIPLTLAIIPALTVTCAGNRYAIPQVNLLELVRLEGDDRENRIEDLHGAPVYRLRGSLLPIVDLRAQLGAEPIERETTNIVVLKADDHQFGLIVDNIEDTEEIVVKPLGRQVKDLRLFSGATIMGDGRIALILDLLGLAGSASLLEPGSQGHEALREQSELMADTHVLDDRTLLLLGLGDQQRVAIPLAAVERLEEFTSEAVEQSEGRSVVQYRNKIMPLIDLGPTIGYQGSAFDGADRISVVVCSFMGRTVGLAVQDILDIVSHAEVLETITDDSESVVIHDLVTDVIDAAAVVASVLPIAYEEPSFDSEPIPDTRSQASIGV